MGLAAAVLLTTAGFCTAAPAQAATPPLAAPRIVAHFDIAAGQQPENLALEPDGSVDLTFSFARQVARWRPGTQPRILATVPAPPPGTVVPLTGAAFVSGIVRAPGGDLYFLYTAGTDDLTGLWKLNRGSNTPYRIAALPATSVPNGLDFSAGQFYASDSANGIVWRIPGTGGVATAWSTAPELSAPAGSFGVNGLKVHRGSVWVTNLAQGTLLRIPIERFGAAGPPRVIAGGLGSVDDFAFTGRGDDVLVAVNPDNRVEFVRSDGTHKTVLTAADGLQNPTSVALRGNLVYVPSAAYFTGIDPNLLTARLLY
jgi:hypothetical protein